MNIYKKIQMKTKYSPSRTHMINTNSPCQDLSNTNAWSKKATAPNVVRMGGMNITKNYKCRVSENQIFLSVILTDSLISVFLQSEANSISPNKFQYDFHFNKLFNVVFKIITFCLKCFKIKKKKEKNCKIFKGITEFLSKFSFNLLFSNSTLILTYILFYLR